MARSKTPDGLTAREHRIVRAFSTNGHHRTNAYREGTGSKGTDKTCITQFRRMMKDNPAFRAAIEKAQQLNIDKTDAVMLEAAMDAAEVARNATVLARGNILDIATWADGKVMLKPSSELTRDQAYMISKLVQTKDGIRLEIEDRRGALDLMAKILGLFKEDPRKFAAEINGVKFIIEG